jgi:uncharacterized protein with PIN domain
LLTATTIQLPFEYLWLSMDYDEEINRKFYKRNEITVEHPACLTSEDRASSLGAAKNRVPPNYDRNITNKVKCNTKFGDFYEYIFFEHKDQLKVMDTYIKWLKGHNVLKFTPYAKKYGKYNSVAKHTNDLAKSIDFQTDKKIVLLTHDSEFKMRAEQDGDVAVGIHYLNKDNILATVCKYMKAGQSVIYVPKDATKSQLKKVITQIDGQVEFITRNINTDQRHYKKEFILKTDRNYPMYFNANSHIMYQLLEISGDLNHVQSIFNSSFIFLSRLRCRWL